MVTTKKGKRPLNTRERKVIKELAAGKSPVNALISAGYTPYTAAAIAPKKLKQLKEPIERLMDKQGITDSKLLKVLNSGLESTRTISAIGNANGGTTDFIEVPDYQTRHRYLETGLKLRGHLKTNTENTTNIQNFLQVKIEINPQDRMNTIEIEPQECITG